MAIWNAGGPALHWVLIALVLLVVPVGVVYAFASSVRGDG
jgi:hypothetical protein